MKNESLDRNSRVEYDHSLNHVLDGFVSQIIFKLTEATEVKKVIGDRNELVYRGVDDMQEMQVQMAVDHHLQMLEMRMRRMILEYIKENKLALHGGRDNKIKVVPNLCLQNQRELGTQSSMNASATTRKSGQKLIY